MSCHLKLQVACSSTATIVLNAGTVAFFGIQMHITFFVVAFPLQHLPLTSTMLGHRCMSSIGVQVYSTPDLSL